MIVRGEKYFDLRLRLVRYYKRLEVATQMCSYQKIGDMSYKNVPERRGRKR